MLNPSETFMCHEVALIISPVYVCVCIEVRVGHGKVAYLSGLERSQGHFVWDNIQTLISCQVKHIVIL